MLRQQLTAEENRTNQVMEELMAVANQKDEEHARCNKYQADLDEKEDELQRKVRIGARARARGRVRGRRRRTRRRRG